MKYLKKNSKIIMVLSTVLIIILAFKLYSFLTKKYNDLKCNNCDNLTLDKNICIKYYPIKKAYNIKYIQKRAKTISNGFLISEDSESYFNKELWGYILKLEVSLIDTIIIFDKKKKYLIYDFKREYVKPKYHMGADNRNYFYELEHPCKSYGFTVSANGVNKFVLSKDSNGNFIINEKNFY